MLRTAWMRTLRSATASKMSLRMFSSLAPLLRIVLMVLQFSSLVGGSERRGQGRAVAQDAPPANRRLQLDVKPQHNTMPLCT